MKDSKRDLGMRARFGRPVLTATVALLALAATSGCTRIREHQGFLGDQLIMDSIAPKIDNRASVQESLGRPTFKSQFGPERWYYVARNTKALAFASPKPTSFLVMTVQFDDKGNVESIDRESDLKELAKIEPVGDKTPTLGRKHSLFSEIFGNIGTVGSAGLPGGGGPGPGGGPNGS